MHSKQGILQPAFTLLALLAVMLLVLAGQHASAQETPAGQHAPQVEDPSASLLDQRLRTEQRHRANRFVLTPHNRNFLLPISVRRNPNTEPYLEEGNRDLARQQQVEVEFQLSIKVLLWYHILGDRGRLYMAYTNHAFWQAYNRAVSSPFRETNHEPELILSFDNAWDVMGFRNVINEVILNHQSNGQGGMLSRSWNRVMLNSVFERGRFAFAFRPWYRIPESEGYGRGDPTGDNNPDIEDYLGHFEWAAAYQRGEQILSVQLRNNLRSNNKGAVELNWTFPFTPTVRGFVKYFHGYGHSLIDYEERVESLGLGITFTDLF